MGIASSNIGGVYTARGDQQRAEPFYREAIATFVATQGAQHLNTGIARLKLGDSLVAQGRYDEAEKELLTGYGILTKQTSPSVSWLTRARENLVKLYTVWHQPEKARKFQAELGTPPSR